VVHLIIPKIAISEKKGACANSFRVTYEYGWRYSTRSHSGENKIAKSNYGVEISPMSYLSTLIAFNSNLQVGGEEVGNKSY
jgi:hypothetical protein